MTVCTVLNITSYFIKIHFKIINPSALRSFCKSHNLIFQYKLCGYSSLLLCYMSHLPHVPWPFCVRHQIILLPLSQNLFYHYLYTLLSLSPYTTIIISIHYSHYLHTLLSLSPYTTIIISIHYYHYLHKLLSSQSPFSWAPLFPTACNISRDQCTESVHLHCHISQDHCTETVMFYYNKLR